MLEERSGKSARIRSIRFPLHPASSISEKPFDRSGPAKGLEEESVDQREDRGNERLPNPPRSGDSAEVQDEGGTDTSDASGSAGSLLASPTICLEMLILWGTSIGSVP
jgi:hypothetical protein